MGRKKFDHADPTANAVARREPREVDDIDLNESAHKSPIQVADIDAKKFWCLPKHSVRLLEAGDMYVLPNPRQLPGKPSLPGRLVTVKSVARSRQGGATVTLDNGYAFDPTLPTHDDHDVTIYRPRRGF